MKLIYDNLSPILQRNIYKDLADVLRLAATSGVSVPDVELHVIALDEPGVPTALPSHELAVPQSQKPLSLNDRCDWQTLRDSFQIISQDPNSTYDQRQTIWVIAGSSSGAMYGLNEMLSATTGIIFAGQVEDDVLFGPTYELPLKPQRPRFAYRGFYGSDTHWTARHKLNFGMAGAAYFAHLNDQQRHEIDDHVKARSIHRTRSEHAMEHFLPPQVLRQNKDWQGMRDGQRCTHAHVTMPDCPQLNARLPVQPCYANPQVRSFIVNNMAALCMQSPAPDFFGVWPHDGVNNWCECAACLKLTPFEHMHQLALELREALPSDHTPGLDMIVYSNMLNLPRHPLAPNDRAMAFFCPYLRPFRHSIFEQGGPEQPLTGTSYPRPDRINPVDEREYGKLFKQWLPHWQKAKITPALFEYPGHFIDETGRSDLQRYGHSPTSTIRENEAIQYAQHGLRIAILCGQPCTWPDHFPSLAWAQSLWGNEPIANLRHRYYAALAGTHGDSLAAAVDGVVAALKLSTDIPKQALGTLEAILKQLPESKQKTAYQDWVHIIKLGRQSFTHRLNNDLENVNACEESLRAYVHKHEDRIAPAQRLIQDSHTYQQRAAAQKTGQRSMHYTL